MKTKDLSAKLVDCAIHVALYAVPGMMESDKEVKEAYKALATDLLLLKPRKSLQHLIPFRMHQIRSERQAVQPVQV
ncbi:hypothetical protein ACSBL2_20335 [Pedobacter sp. AW31-3R]|uniref:hypothetical protein n=1 Tax=Pedobacter sp. AW31-3R TaxID=3445781 RepID=UPI003FA0178E